MLATRPVKNSVLTTELARLLVTLLGIPRKPAIATDGPDPPPPPSGLEPHSLLSSHWSLDALASAAQDCAPNSPLWTSPSHEPCPGSHRCVPLFHGAPRLSHPPAASTSLMHPYPLGWPQRSPDSRGRGLILIRCLCDHSVIKSLFT